MKARKILALLLGFAMVLSATGCGNSDVAEESKSEVPVSSTQNSEEVKEDLYYNTEGYPICDEPITLTMSCKDYTGILDDPQRVQTDEYASRLGIQIDVIPYTSDAYSTQLSLMLAEDDLPDIIARSGFSAAEVADYGEQGYFLDLSQYLHLMPNLQAVFEQYPLYKAMNTTESGAIYGLNKLNGGIGPSLQAYFNKAWLDNLDLEVPTTVDELYEVLKAFKEEDANGNGDPNDEIPMQYTYEWGLVDQYLYGAFGMTPQEDERAIVDVDENGEVRLTFMSDNYKAYLQYMHKLYSEGLIDQECFSATDDIILQKYRDDLIGFGGSLTPYITYGTTIDQDFDLGVYAYPMTSDYNDQAILPFQPIFADSNYLLVSADCEYPEAVCRLIDYLFTVEGAMSAQYGYEGITFDYVDMDGLGYSVKWLSPEEYKGNDDGFRIEKAVVNSALDVCKVYSLPDTKIKNNTFLMMDAVPKYQAGEIDEATYEEYREKYGWYLMAAEMIVNSEASGAKRVDVYPTLCYTAEEAEIRDKVRAAIDAYLADTKAQFIIGGLDFESDWDNYIKELNAMGAQELLAVEQAAYARIQ